MEQLSRLVRPGAVAVSQRDIIDRCVLVMLNEACYILSEGMSREAAMHADPCSSVAHAVCLMHNDLSRHRGTTCGSGSSNGDGGRVCTVLRWTVLLC